MSVPFADASTSHLGPCCCCESDERVHSILFLDGKAPIPGRGWGCLTCGLAANGAVAVVCNACLANPISVNLTFVLRFACRGFPATDGRIPIGELCGHHEHDLSRHPEIQQGDPSCN